MHQNSDKAIDDILATTKVIALIGASANPERPSNRVMAFMQDRGYRVIPVNPGLAGQTLHGETVYANLPDIPDQIEMVDVFRQADQCPAIARDAVAMGAQTLWLQLDVVSEEAATIAGAANMNVVMDRCPKIELFRPFCEPKLHLKI